MPLALSKSCRFYVLKKGNTDMELSLNELNNRTQWENAGINLPEFDIAECRRKTYAEPTWVHIGSGNIFRAFIARIAQRLLNQKLISTGIITCGTHDFESFDLTFAPFDNLCIMCDLKADGNIGCEVIGSITEAMAADPDRPENIRRLRDIAVSDSLQIISFTITEKGYALRDADGNLYENVRSDMLTGPSRTLHCMSFVASLLWERFKAGGAPIALLSMDNCSHNGELLQKNVMEIVDSWIDAGFVTEDFKRWCNNPSKVAFPWSMIDKITPRPSDEVLEHLTAKGITNLTSVKTSKGIFCAPFVNAEVPEYLVVEDTFPNGRPPLDKGGVILTDRETVDKCEKMKVTACLNPLHTSLAIYGCLLGFNKISDEMKDKDLSALVNRMGHEECLPAVTNPGILNPTDFLNEVLNERLVNPFIPDMPQRIATDTSQKLPIRFGITMKHYLESESLNPRDLKFVPFTLAGWLRYLTGIDDNGNSFEISPDPMADLFRRALKDAGVSYGSTKFDRGLVAEILSNETVFGIDVNKTGLTADICDLLSEMLSGPGAVRKLLHRVVNE